MVRAAEYGMRLAHLRVIPLDGENGPYTEAQIKQVEAKLQRPLSPQHRQFLLTEGGSLGFETGAVDVGTTKLDIDVLYGVGEDDHHLLEGSSFYRGQVPEGWYAIGRSAGGLFELDDQNRVWYVELKGELCERDACPELPPPLAVEVADDFDAFLKMLRLPFWANKH
jgi:hypothetical protein